MLYFKFLLKYLNVSLIITFSNLLIVFFSKIGREEREGGNYLMFKGYSLKKSIIDIFEC